MFVMFYICYKSKKEHTTWNDNSGMRVLHNFQCTFLLQYIVSATYTKFLYMDMTIALKSLNEMQQTASTVIYVTYFQVYYGLMQ